MAVYPRIPSEQLSGGPKGYSWVLAALATWLSGFPQDGGIRRWVSSSLSSWNTSLRRLEMAWWELHIGPSGTPIMSSSWTPCPHTLALHLPFVRCCSLLWPFKQSSLNTHELSQSSPAYGQQLHCQLSQFYFLLQRLQILRSGASLFFSDDLPFLHDSVSWDFSGVLACLTPGEDFAGAQRKA